MKAKPLFRMILNNKYMENTVNERFKVIIKELQYKSIRAFASKIGVSQTSFNDIINGAEPKYSTIFKALKAEPNINAEWLITGEGEMLNSRPESAKQDSDLARPFVDTAYATCGKPGGFNVSLMEQDFEKIILPFVDDYNFSIRAKGDSMVNRMNPQRSIRQGDILACRRINSIEDIRMGEVYALCTDGDVIVKKLAPSQKEGYITCISYNTEDGYLPFDLKINDIYDWALVKGVVSVNLW